MATPEMLDLLLRLRHKCAIGFVGGSNLIKQQEQIGRNTVDVRGLFDYCFAENGLTAYRMGAQLPSMSFIQYIGEERYQALVDFVLRYISSIKLPRKRGTFVEYRAGMVNISPVGRAASAEERNEFEAFDKVHHVRRDLVDALRKEFPDFGLTYAALPFALSPRRVCH